MKTEKGGNWIMMLLQGHRHGSCCSCCFVVTGRKSVPNEVFTHGDAFIDFNHFCSPKKRRKEKNLLVLLKFWVVYYVIASWNTPQTTLSITTAPNVPLMNIWHNWYDTSVYMRRRKTFYTFSSYFHSQHTIKTHINNNKLH